MSRMGEWYQTSKPPNSAQSGNSPSTGCQRCNPSVCRHILTLGDTLEFVIDRRMQLVSPGMCSCVLLCCCLYFVAADRAHSINHFFPPRRFDTLLKRLMQSFMLRIQEPTAK